MRKSKKRIVGSNPSSSLSQYSKKSYDTVNQEIFIGIVKNIIDHDSDNLESIRDIPEELEEYVDNRNIAYITPIDSNFSNSIVPAFFINSHDIDYPLVEEAVLCVSTDLGNIIIDRLSIYGYGLNYDMMNYLQSSGSFVDDNRNIVTTKENEDEFLRENIKKVAPFFAKKGSRAILGRNNQYLIFDAKERLNSSEKIKENTSSGKFVKLGIRENGSQQDTKEDNQIIITKDALLQFALNKRIPSNYNVSEEDEPMEGIGIQSKEIILKGSQFVVVYSNEDMLIKAENMYIQSILTEMDSDRINMVPDADNPAVKSNELTDLFNDLIDILDGAQAITPWGPAPIDPATRLKLQKLKLSYLENIPKYSSRKVFVD